MGDHENIAVEIPWGGLLIKQYSGISMGMGQTDMWNFHGGGQKYKNNCGNSMGGGRKKFMSSIGGVRSKSAMAHFVSVCRMFVVIPGK